MTDLVVVEQDALIGNLTKAGVLGSTWADFSSLIPPGDEGFERYENFARLLSRSLSACKWWIAELLLFGEGALGERYSQAADAFGLSERTMQDYVWVAQNVPRSRRRDDLSFSHHRAVAKRKVSPEQQTELLELAARRDLSARELDEEVRAINAKPDSAPEWSEPIDADLMRRALDRRTVVAAGYSVVRQAKPRDGGWWVPNEQMARLRAAVGEEK